MKIHLNFTIMNYILYKIKKPIELSLVMKALCRKSQKNTGRSISSLCSQALKYTLVK